METRFEVEEKIKNGIYRLTMNRGRKSSIWKMYALIQKDDGLVFEGFVYCRGCKKLLKYDGKKTSNLNRHNCFLVSSLNTNAAVESYVPPKESAELEKNAQQLIADKLKSGEYTLYDKPKGKSPIWQLYARICHKDGGPLVEGHVQCRQCKNIFRYDGLKTSNLNRHKCYIQWRLQSEGAKRPKLEAGGDVSKTDLGEEYVDDEEDEDVEFYEDNDYEENSSNNSFVNNISSLVEDEATNQSFEMELIQRTIESQLESGSYKLSDIPTATSPLWSFFGFIIKEDGSMLEGLVCCRHCKLVLKYTSSNLRNLHMHICGTRLSRGVKIKDEVEQEFLDESYTISGFDEFPSSAPVVVKEEITPIQGAIYTSLTSSNNTPTDCLALPTQIDVSQITVLPQTFAVKQENVSPEVSAATTCSPNPEFVYDDEGDLATNMSDNDEYLQEDNSLHQGFNSKSENSRFEVEANLKAGKFKLVQKQNCKSRIWQIFALVANAEDNTLIEGYVYCRRCKKLLKNQRGTSNLGRHPCCIGSLHVGQADHEEILLACSQWLIEDCRSPANLEGTGFQKLIAAFLHLGAQYGENLDIKDLVPEQDKVARHIHLMAEEKKINILRDLQQQPLNGSITIDMWSDSWAKRNFFSVTLHYAKNFQLFELVLGIKSLELPKTNEMVLLQKLKKLLASFGLENLEDLIFITEKGNLLEKTLQGETRFDCSSHLFGQVLEEAIANTSELKAIIEDTKAIIRCLKRNPEQQQELVKPLTSPRCYAGHYERFKQITEQWSQINDLISSQLKQQLNISDNTLEALQGLVKLCQKFEIIFKTLQETRLPSLCFVVPSINRLKVMCEALDKDVAEIVAFKHNLLQSVQTLWANNINIWHKTAFFLYPPANQEPDNQSAEIKEFCLKKMKEFPPTKSSQAEEVEAAETLDKASKEKDDLSFFFPNLCKRPPNGAASCESTAEEELRRYSRENVIIDDNFDVCQWWRDNASNYPLLSQLALRTLAIPASTKGLAKVRPLAKHIVYEKSHGLSPKSVDNILLLNSMSQMVD